MLRFKPEKTCTKVKREKRFYQTLFERKVIELLIKLYNHDKFDGNLEYLDERIEFSDFTEVQ